jgi:uncharacterized protein
MDPELLLTDLAEVRRLAHELWEENCDFRDFVNHALGWSDKKLNALVNEVAGEMAAAIDCRTCGACCRELDVAVTAADCRRLARWLGLSPARFEDRFTKIGDEGDREFASRPCSFLSGTTCSVYQYRPVVCRSYPYLDQGFRKRGLTAISNAETCPIVFNTIEELKRRIPWRDPPR